MNLLKRGFFLLASVFLLSLTSNADVYTVNKLVSDENGTFLLMANTMIQEKLDSDLEEAFVILKPIVTNNDGYVQMRGKIRIYKVSKQTNNEGVLTIEADGLGEEEGSCKVVFGGGKPLKVYFYDADDKDKEEHSRRLKASDDKLKLEKAKDEEPISAPVRGAGIRAPADVFIANVNVPPVVVPSKVQGNGIDIGIGKGSSSKAPFPGIGIRAPADVYIAK